MACKIRCEWAEQKRFVTNPDGQVWPCCYWANFDYYVKNNEVLHDGPKNQMKHPVYQAYQDSAEAHNAFNRPTHEILQSKWFNETLPESWDSDAPFLCVKHCEHEV